MAGLAKFKSSGGCKSGKCNDYIMSLHFAYIPLHFNYLCNGLLGCNPQSASLCNACNNVMEDGGGIKTPTPIPGTSDKISDYIS